MNAEKRGDTIFFRNLDTPRLRLCALTEAHRDFIYMHFANEQVSRYLYDAEPPTAPNDADEIIAFYRQPEPRTHHRWVLIDKQSGQPIGTCGFHCWDRDTRTCEVGYDLAAENWGKGYMSEALHAIIAFARDDMEVRRIHACVYPSNERSMAIAKRLGFVDEGRTMVEVFRGGSYTHAVLALDVMTCE